MSTDIPAIGTDAWLREQLARLAEQRERTDALRQRLAVDEQRSRRLEPLRIVALVAAGAILGSTAGTIVVDRLAAAAACR